MVLRATKRRQKQPLGGEVREPAGKGRPLKCWEDVHGWKDRLEPGGRLQSGKGASHSSEQAHFDSGGRSQGEWQNPQFVSERRGWGGCGYVPTVSGAGLLLH